MPLPKVSCSRLISTTYPFTSFAGYCHRRLGAAHSDPTLTLTLTPHPNPNQGSEQLTQTEYLLHRETLLR
eukprot:scaffold61518_cov45-Phaeocystis_antarctica.AAC.1